MSRVEWPRAEGECGAAYLEEALERAGRPAPSGSVRVEVLTEGRMGAEVTALRSQEGADYVLKAQPVETWRARALGRPDGGEASLWMSGLTRDLPAPVSCPTVDVAIHEKRDEIWMLMEDVGRGIRSRDAFNEEDSIRLLRALARLHARFWGKDDELSRHPLPDVAGPTEVFARPLLRLAGRSEDAPEWTLRFLEDLSFINDFVERFFDPVGNHDADLLLQIAEDRRRWLGLLDREEQTLNHGDLRRANVAFIGDEVVLLDWEFASRAPAACDLQWHWMMQLCAYPPDDNKSITEREPVRDAYVEALESDLGGSIDRDGFDRAWDLAWLRVMVQIGFLLADPLVGDSSPREAEAARMRCHHAMSLVRDIVERRL